MRIKLALNASPLLLPLTGIGHYTACLLERLRESEDIEIYPFYNTAWMRPPGTLMRWSLGAMRRLLGVASRRQRAIGRSVQQRVFDQGIDRYGITLYHEPNYCPLEFGGSTVITVCDLAFIRYPQTMPSEQLRTLERCMPRAVAHAAHILVISEFTKNELIALFGVAPDNITITYPGVRSQFRPRTDSEIASLLQRYRLGYRRYILFVGTLEPRKNLVRTLRAYGALPVGLKQRYPLVLVGMTGWLTQEIERELDAPGTKEYARSLKYVPEAHLAELFAGAAMLVYPSLYEGFGMPLSEAMACGVPVITSDCASMPEVAGQAGILVNPLDIDAIASAMRELAESPAEAARRGALGIARAAAYSWDACARRTIAVYRKCAKS